MKRTLKKILCLVMAATMGLFVLTGCNGSSTQSAAGTSSATSTAPKSDKKIAIVCDSAGQNDNGYNQAAVNGAKQAAITYGVQYKVVEPTNGVPAALEALADDGYNVIFSLQYDFDALIKGVGGAKPLAETYPDTTFVVFNDNPNVKADGSVKYKNVISVMFDVHEGSFLAGALSVLVNENAKTLFGTDGYKFVDPANGGRTIGFIGGTNSNGITVFSDGYIQGINYIAKELNVKYNYYAKYDAGFTDSALGSTVAGTYYDKGANIVYGVAGGVGEGITSKAKEVGRLAIQVDANKDSEQSGYVLTSVLKNTNVPVLKICQALVENKLSSMQSLQSYSLSSGATGITNLSEISKHIANTDAAKAKWKEIQDKISQIKGKIGSEIKVVNASAGEKFDPSTCPNVVIK